VQTHPERGVLEFREKADLKKSGETTDYEVRTTFGGKNIRRTAWP
jgi:hypothetical protein